MAFGALAYPRFSSPTPSQSAMYAEDDVWLYQWIRYLERTIAVNNDRTIYHSR